MTWTEIPMDESAAHQIRIQYGPFRALCWSCTCQPRVGEDNGVAVRRPIAMFAGATLVDVLAAHAAHATQAETDAVAVTG